MKASDRTMARFRAAKVALVDDVRALVAELVPGGRQRGKYWAGARCPWRPDKHAGSFFVYLDGPAAGGFKDYAGETGDVFHLVANALGISVFEALKWAEDRYGIRGMDAGARQRLEEEGRKRRERMAAEAKVKTRDDRKGASRMFREASAEINAAVLKYFRGRGCPLEAIQTLDRGSFRSYASFEWWMGARRNGKGEKIAPGPSYPCLVSAFRDELGRGRAVHMTFVARDGKGKAPVEIDGQNKAKLIWPNPEGCTIRISHGESGMSPEEAAANGVVGPLLVCEGLEDGSTFAGTAPALRVHAAGSLWGLATLPDFACADSYLLARDKDWGKGQAQELFEFAIARLRTTGKPVEPIEAPIGKDINDTMRSFQ